MAQSIKATRNNLFTVLGTLFPQTTTSTTLVSRGDPGEYTPDLIVAMMGTRAPITQPTAGTNRSRDKRIAIDLVISSYVHGGIEAQQPAEDAAWDAADLIEAYFRTSPNETLSGACYNAFAETTDVNLSVSWERIDDMADPVPVGRIADISMTVTAWIRI